MKETQKGYLMCFIGVITWSFSEIIVKLLGEVGFISLSFLRFFIGGFFLLIIILIQKENTKDLLLITRKYKWLMIISAVIGLGISNMIYFLGLQFTNANVGAALYTTYPIFISIYSIFLLKERSNLKLKAIGYSIGITGTLILMTNFQFELLFQPQNIIGNILLVFAAVLFAFQSVIGKMIFRKSEDISNIEIKYTTTSFLLACIPIIILLLFTPELNTFLIYRFWSIHFLSRNKKDRIIKRNKLSIIKTNYFNDILLYYTIRTPYYCFINFNSHDYVCSFSYK